LQESLRSRKNLLELQETSAKEHAAQHKALRAAQAAYSFVGTVAAATATASSSKISLNDSSAAAATAVTSGNRWRAAAAADNAFDADEKIKLGLVPTAAAATNYHKQHRSGSSSSSGEVKVDATAASASSYAKDTAEEEYAGDQFTVDDGVNGDLQQGDDHSNGGGNNDELAADFTAANATDNAEVAVDVGHEKNSILV
jgi:hypothetical protein